MVKEDIVKFIEARTNYTRPELMKLTRKELYDIMKEKHILYDFVPYNKKEIKYLVDVRQHSKHFVLKINADKTKAQTVEDLQQKGFLVDKIVLKRGHHVCPSCGHIANGTGIHILCDNCKKRVKMVS